MQAWMIRWMVAGAAAAVELVTLVACGDGGVGTNGTGSPVPVGLNAGTGHDERVGAQALPNVVGRVSERTGDTLGILGQTVTVNSDPARGPVTTFESPLTGLADVGLGDALEVHALAQRTGSGTSDVRFVATRIERRGALAGVRVSGTVAEPAASDGTRSFRLGALTVQLPSTAAVLPAGTELLAGHSVMVYAAESGFDAATLTLVASHVQITPAKLTAATRIDPSGCWATALTVSWTDQTCLHQPVTAAALVAVTAHKTKRL